jgi:TonB family protein
MLRRIWLLILTLILLLATCATSLASVPVAAPRLRHTVLSQREHQAWKLPTHAAEFRDIPHSSARARCEDVNPPQALTTPDPLPVPAVSGFRAKVSIIVGTDGRVHSPLILESAGAAGDRNILQTIRSWRYRPATCNGMPTEAEGKIEFSHR